MAFPQTRMRRLRSSPTLRGLVRETELRAGQLVLPLFVSQTIAGSSGFTVKPSGSAAEAQSIAARLPLASGSAAEPLGSAAELPEALADRLPIATMPGVERLSLAAAVHEAGEAARLGLAAVLLFGIPAEKDASGSAAWDDEGIVQLCTRAIKQAHPELLVITDVCLCEYTEHGHCGVLHADGSVENDATLELLARIAVSHARAGADIVAPSDMMDGRVATIRGALDEEGFSQTPILAYSAKFASAFYGPFRDAAGSAPAFGDRRGYQLDPANAREAVREALLDAEEGVMVKPALAYGDLIRAVRRATRLPIAVYNVSGEYAMVKAAAAAGYLDERATVMEILTSLRRAGADVIISYHAKDAALWLAE
jgi:porphobilinogen synthase